MDLINAFVKLGYHGSYDIRELVALGVSREEIWEAESCNNVIISGENTGEYDNDGSDDWIEVVKLTDPAEEALEEIFDIDEETFAPQPKRYWSPTCPTFEEIFG